MTTCEEMFGALQAAGRGEGAMDWQAAAAYAWGAAMIGLLAAWLVIGAMLVRTAVEIIRKFGRRR